jgi:5-methyltetrahydropteroyltriglutamate--homocysteine methyltransferase
LKKAVESYWKGNSSEEDLQNTAQELRAAHWKLQQEAGIGHIPSNDFSLYDQVLDTISLVGAVPERYNFTGDKVDLTTYFAMARGRQQDGQDVVAMEMTKWFDTNYHYIVPEFTKSTEFRLASTKIIDEYNEAKALGVDTRPVLLGPISFLTLGKSYDSEVNPIDLLPQLLPVYQEVLGRLRDAGAEYVQIDEPCLVLDLDEQTRAQYLPTYQQLAEQNSELKLIVTTYFEGLRDNLDTAVALPVHGLHIDLVRAPGQLDDVLAKLPEGRVLSLGLIDGRNIWINNLKQSLATVAKVVDQIGSERVIIAPSCSLLHSPVDLDSEQELDEELKSWLAFAKQKVAEVVTLTRAINEGESAVASTLAANLDANELRQTSERIHNPDVKRRISDLKPEMVQRHSRFDSRIKLQRENLALPLLPTTTIGSFPQTNDIRAARASFRKGGMDRNAYDAFLEQQTTEVIKFQEEIGIDVLVHGEYERNDMVEYFGEKLNGYAFTKFGWVQSYGSRCVKPPIIYGDVSRSEPMTVRWTSYAQSLTDKLVKGMLTGPVTMLQWSFVRDDQPRSETCRQIAFAIRDEVIDLEVAGIKVIQVDEAALREGLPLRRSDWSDYLDWAVQCFHITADGVRDETQIHTHMCYSEFNDIIEAVADMDADVISIETSRSAMELLDAFVEFKYPNDIGPGVYDIHSPRIPQVDEMEKLLDKALEVLSPEQVWVNPDCGLKTRGWAEVEPALRGMVEATERVRDRLNGNGEAVNA